MKRRILAALAVLVGEPIPHEWTECPHVFGRTIYSPPQIYPWETGVPPQLYPWVTTTQTFEIGDDLTRTITA